MLKVTPRFQNTFEAGAEFIFLRTVFAADPLRDFRRQQQNLSPADALPRLLSTVGRA